MIIVPPCSYPDIFIGLQNIVSLNKICIKQAQKLPPSQNFQISHLNLKCNDTVKICFCKKIRICPLGTSLFTGMQRARSSIMSVEASRVVYCMTLGICLVVYLLVVGRLVCLCLSFVSMCFIFVLPSTA